MLDPLCEFGSRKDHEASHAQTACRDMHELPMTSEICCELNDGGEPIKVWFEVGASEKRIGDGCDFLQRYGDEIWHGCFFRQGIEEARSK